MVMKTIRIGVLGGRRGRSMIRFCRESEYTQLAAVCDKDERILRSLQEGVGEEVPCLSSFEAFLEQDMDAVVLANYATEHAPFAIRCLEAGFHVFSEVLPAQTMREAVELVEAVERTGRVYAYGENYCYMPAPREMRRLYREGVIGEFEYGEGEYVHNCEPIWPVLTGGDPDHWRNGMYATFYCTHSIGPLLHITGLRPVRVTGFEGTKTERKVRCGAKGGSFGMGLIELDNGGLLKSLHGDLYRDSVWYCLYGSKGRMESGRADAGGGVSTLYVGADRYSGEYAPVRPKARILTDGLRGKAGDFGHEGSDYYAMHHFVKKIRGSRDADVIGIYEALDMFLPGLFAYRSVLRGGIPMEIPNLRDRAARERYRHDTMCTDPKTAGDQWIPSFSKGNPDIPGVVYRNMRNLWDEGGRRTEPDAAPL